MAFVPAQLMPRPPYGMGDCRSFLDIPPLVHWDNGLTCINPDFEMVRKFHLAAKAKDPAFPERGLQPAVTIAPDDEVEFQLTVEREENAMGHLLINELFMLTDPAGAGSLSVEIKNTQADKTYTNSAVFNWTVFSNSHLSCCLPCPIMLYPNQTIVFKVRNLEAVPVEVRISARGKRFMPYHDMGLVREMEECWNRNPSSPYWLGLDTIQVEIPAGGRAQAQMTVPGGAYFELKQIRGKVQPIGTVGPDDILVNVTEGRIGRRLMNEPIPLSLYMADDKFGVTGFPGDVYRSASACHCPGPSMIFRGNTRIIHDFTNLDTVNDAFVEMTYVGCLHYASRCPPGADLDRVRRSAGVFTAPQIEGWGAGEDGSYSGGVFEPNYDCLPNALPQQAPQAPQQIPPRSPGLYGLGGPDRSQGEWERI